MTVLLIPLTIILSVILVGFLYYQLLTRKFTSAAIKTKARIVSNNRYQATKSSVFIPTLIFTDQTGQEITVEGGMSGASSLSRKTFKVNDELPILYDAANPENFIVDSWYGRYVYTLKKSAIAVLIVIIAGVVLMLTM